MGASSSTQQNNISAEQRELESEAASTGALPMLDKAFSKLSDPQTKAISVFSLQESRMIKEGEYGERILTALILRFKNYNA